MFHVGFGIGYRLQLVGCFLVEEALFELPLPRRVGPEGVARALLAGAVEGDELVGDLARRRAHPCLGLLPVAAAHAMQRRRVAARVVADGIDLVGGHVELVAAAVLQQQVVALGAAEGALHHAAVAGDAVLVVHEEPLGVRAPGPWAPMGAAAAGHVVLGQDGELHARQDEAPLERLDDDGSLGKWCGGRVRVQHWKADALLGEQRGDA